MEANNEGNKLLNASACEVDDLSTRGQSEIAFEVEFYANIYIHAVAIVYCIAIIIANGPKLATY